MIKLRVHECRDNNERGDNEDIDPKTKFFLEGSKVADFRYLGAKTGQRLGGEPKGAGLGQFTWGPVTLPQRKSDIAVVTPRH
jgi:hypothetical protein